MEDARIGAIPVAGRGDPGSIIGYTRKGTPIYPIAGAQDPPAGDPPAGDPPKNDPPTPDPEGLGDAGKRALQAEREARAAAEERAKEAERKLKEIDDAKLSESERLQKAAADEKSAREKAEAERDAERFTRKVERAAAKFGYIDPEDAARLIDRSSVKTDDAGIPDDDSLQKALKRLAESKPHLVGGSVNGSGDGGGRRSPPAGESMNDLIRGAAGRA